MAAPGDGEMVFSLDQLNFFVTAARCGSFSEAGRQLDRSQSAVSTAVANLEIALGVELFDRGAKYLELTAEGEILLRDAESILYRCGNFQNRALAFSDGTDSRLRIAVDESLQERFSVSLLHRFEKKFPFTEFEIQIGLFNDIQARVAGGEADIGLMVGTGIPDRVANYRLITYLPFRAVSAESHPLAEKKAVTLADLEGDRQAIVTGKGEQRNSEMTVFSGRTWILESYAAALSIVKRGLGWGFFPEHFVAQAVRDHEVVHLTLRVEQRSHTSPVYLLWSKEALSRKAGRWIFEQMTDSQFPQVFACP